MSFFDKVKDLAADAKDKVDDLAEQHEDQIKTGIDKAADLAGTKLGADKAASIAKAADKAKDVVGDMAKPDAGEPPSRHDP